MKRRLIYFLLSLALFSSHMLYGKELEGVDLKVLNMALDTRLYINDTEDPEEQLTYLKRVEDEISVYQNDISPETQLICKSIFTLHYETIRTTKLIRQNPKKYRSMNAKPDVSKEDNVMVQCFYEMEKFASEHNDLSSYFYYHLLESQFSLMPYLTLDKQIKLMIDTVEEYKKINERVPENSECLFTQASILYTVPKVAGGDKELATSKILDAIKYSKNNFELTSSMVLYSQFLFEEKKFEESKKYFDGARVYAPENKTAIDIEKLNSQGHSMLDPRAMEKLYKEKMDALTKD